MDRVRHHKTAFTFSVDFQTDVFLSTFFTQRQNLGNITLARQSSVDRFIEKEAFESDPDRTDNASIKTVSVNPGSKLWYRSRSGSRSGSGGICRAKRVNGNSY